MFIHPRSKNRPFHLGPFPLESLPREASITGTEAARPRQAPSAPGPRDGLLAAACDKYREVFTRFVDGDLAPARAVPLDRKAAVEAAALLETPDEARRRVAAGGKTPDHYVATPPADDEETGAAEVASPLSLENWIKCLNSLYFVDTGCIMKGWVAVARSANMPSCPC